MGERIRPTSFAHGRIPQANHGLPSIIDDEMRRQRHCVRCHEHYVEWQNIGAWNCRDHMMPFDDDSKKFPCCNRTSTRGCVACDHAENAVRPYEGSVTDYAITRGAPAFRLCRGNLKELEGVYKEAIQRPPDEDEQKRTLGEERVTIYIYRRAVFGNPSDSNLDPAL